MIIKFFKRENYEVSSAAACMYTVFIYSGDDIYSL